MKTKEEAQQALIMIRNELKRLPDYNAFNSSNKEEKAELREYILELEKFINDGNISYVMNEDVKLWLEGGWSPISDFF